MEMTEMKGTFMQTFIDYLYTLRQRRDPIFWGTPYTRFDYIYVVHVSLTGDPLRPLAIHAFVNFHFDLLLA